MKILNRLATELDQADKTIEAMRTFITNTKSDSVAGEDGDEVSLPTGSHQQIVTSRNGLRSLAYGVFEGGV